MPLLLVFGYDQDCDCGRSMCRGRALTRTSTRRLANRITTSAAVIGDSHIRRHHQAPTQAGCSRSLALRVLLRRSLYHESSPRRDPDGDAIGIQWFSFNAYHHAECAGSHTRQIYYLLEATKRVP